MNNKKHDPLKFTSLVVTIAIIMVLVVFSMVIYIKYSIHNERDVYLAAQTEVMSGLIDRTIERYLDYSESCATFIPLELKEGDNVFEFMNDSAHHLYVPNARVILVDSYCTWYGENNTTGRITALDSYASDTDKTLVYMTTGVDVTVDGMVFRTRLDKPITVNTDSGPTDICYCAVICYMDDLQDQLNDAFPYTCNSFIINETGLMLYKDFELGLITSGSNVFAKYERMDFLYGDTGEDLIKKILERETVVGEFKSEKENYFICTSPLSINNWSASFVMRSDELSAGRYITPIFIYIAAIGVLFAGAAILGGLAIIKNKDSKLMLEKERVANLYLEKASTAKSKFLSNMSHDIRTPINGIMGMTAIAQMEDNPAKTNECLSKIAVSSKYLLSLVNDVLDMSSIENGKTVIKYEPANITDFMNECTGIVQGIIQGRNLELITDYSGLKAQMLMLDEVHLRQILINIAGNAVKFTPDGGSVSITACEISQEDNRANIQIKIRDTGIGIEPEFLKNIWDRFSQSKTGSRTEYKGTGLGMAISKDLANLMGGDVNVESEVGKGSEFTVIIPCELAPEQKEEPEADIKDVRILLVEDNDINLEIATELLSDAGAIIETAENGRIALEKFMKKPENSFDVILMDIFMPEMNGYEATAAIRSLVREDAKSIPIIAMTANNTEADMAAAKDAGMNDKLDKPMDIQKVIKVIYGYTKGKGV